MEVFGGARSEGVAYLEDLVAFVSLHELLSAYIELEHLSSSHAHLALELIQERIIIRVLHIRSRDPRILHDLLLLLFVLLLLALLDIDHIELVLARVCEQSVAGQGKLLAVLLLVYLRHYAHLPLLHHRLVLETGLGNQVVHAQELLVHAVVTLDTLHRDLVQMSCFTKVKYMGCAI